MRVPTRGGPDGCCLLFSLGHRGEAVLNGVASPPGVRDDAAHGPRRSPPSLLGRYRQIARVLVGHGLADLVEMVHLGPSVAFGARLLPTRSRLDRSLSRAARFRLALEELGPTFIKFGQLLSTRADVLPPDVIAELSRLQDRVPALPPGAAEAVIEAELRRPVRDVYARFDPVPLAAASIAQVHRAVLTSGELVAVKVRRPDAERVITGDLDVLRHLARLVERHVTTADVIQPSGLVDEFARTIRGELNLVREGRNLDRLTAAFAGDDTVRFPHVYWEWTTPGVLTLELFQGLTVTEVSARGADAETRRLIASRGADAMLTQILVHGFFHADPHPGNLLVLPGNVIGFLDLGIVGRIDDRLQDQLAGVIRAVGHRDAGRLAAVTVAIASPAHEVDESVLERDLAELIDTYADVPLAHLSMSAVLGDVVQTAARHRLRIPSNLMLLIKAVVTIEAVGRAIDPSFKMVEHAAPLAERLWLARYSPAAISARVGRMGRQAASALGDVPVALDAVLRAAKAGRLEVQFVHRNLEHFVREMDRSSNRLSFAIVIGSLVVASALIIQAGVGPLLSGYSVIGLAGFLVAGILGMGLAVGVLRSGRL